MKKILSIFTALSLIAAIFVGTNTVIAKKASTTITVECTHVPHYFILKAAQPLLKKEGIDLKIVEVNDYVQPNLHVNDGSIDANFFQHQPYLDDFNKKRGTKLVAVAKVHVEPMGVYSKTVKKIKDLKKGAVVSIPNDGTNCGRALLLLQKNGLIKLNKKAGITATEKDIISNPKGIVIKPLEAPMLPRTLGEVDASVINTNFALQAKLDPLKDAIAIEDKDSPYANILVVKKGNENKTSIKKLAKILNSPEIKKFIQDKYKGQIVPAF